MSRRKQNQGFSEAPAEESKSIGAFFRDVGVRETIESILVAVMLALLFKAFEAEAFVIPTGSMAPTLQGEHKDIICQECGFNYRVSASQESPQRGMILETTCPICRYVQPINEASYPNHDTFSGDRILVSKFAYDIAEPNRWDVIVFRYPLNAKQNYIKRLTGLPGEHLLIECGDLWVAPNLEDESSGRYPKRDDFEIARKEPRKLLAMLQLVDDNHYVAESLQEAGWPLRWQEWSTPEDARAWQAESLETQITYRIDPTPTTSWLRYRHLIPHQLEWREIRRGRLPERMEGDPQGGLITDFYEYNQAVPNAQINYQAVEDNRVALRGNHWVGDLALEADLEVLSEQGRLSLQLVEGGVRFTCSIDVATGQAQLSADSPDVAFDDSGTREGPSAETRLRGTGRYRVRLANADNQLYVWINDRPVEFSGATTYQRAGLVLPQWSPEDPGDAEPLGIGAENLALQVDRLKVLRDVYYVSVSSSRGTRNAGPDGDEYEGWSSRAPRVYQGDFVHFNRPVRIQQILGTPALWSTPDAQMMFQSRYRDPALWAFDLEADQFFAMGDNSPSSSDARAWRDHHFVERENLVGKALFLYWPHTWWRPIPFLPNFKRMGFIR